MLYKNLAEYYFNQGKSMTNHAMIQKIKQSLQADSRLWSDDNTALLDQTKLIDLVEKLDPIVIENLLMQSEVRDKFFIKIKDVYVFNLNDNLKLFQILNMMIED